MFQSTACDKVITQNMLLHPRFSAESCFDWLAALLKRTRKCCSLKEVSAEQRVQVVVHGQLVAVPQDGGHAVQVGRRGHEEAVLPRRGRQGVRAGVAHRAAAHLVGGHLRRVVNPLQEGLDPGGTTRSVSINTTACK